MAGQGEGLKAYADALKRLRDEEGYHFGEHYLPHDVEVRSLSTGKTRKATLEGLGVRPIRVVPRTDDVADGIQAVRNALGSCWFDRERCADGIRALDAYRKEFDPKLGTFRNRPRHDWASHGADAFRTFAVGYRPRGADRAYRTAVMDKDPI